MFPGNRRGLKTLITRSAGVILTRRARELRKKTGDSRYRARVEDEQRSLSKMIWISCMRPMSEDPKTTFPGPGFLTPTLLVLLLTEPTVGAFSVS
jgi:hypothetical protein